MGMHSNSRLLMLMMKPTSIPASLPPLSLRSFLPYCSIIKRYNSGGRKDEKQEENVIDDDDDDADFDEVRTTIAGDHVRAPSLADEFKRMEGEKFKEEHHLHEVEDSGIASQTVGKTMDGLDEASDKENLDSVKNRYKEHEPGADYRRRGTNTTRY
ncbi:hypothetical protein LINGRAHAP2_LOCUS21147 [Linum grandiflorum]